MGCPRIHWLPSLFIENAKTLDNRYTSRLSCIKLYPHTAGVMIMTEINNSLRVNSQSLVHGTTSLLNHTFTCRRHLCFNINLGTSPYAVHDGLNMEKHPPKMTCFRLGNYLYIYVCIIYIYIFRVSRLSFDFRSVIV